MIILPRIQTSAHPSTALSLSANNASITPSTNQILPECTTPTLPEFQNQSTPNKLLTTKIAPLPSTAPAPVFSHKLQTAAACIMNISLLLAIGTPSISHAHVPENIPTPEPYWSDFLPQIAMANNVSLNVGLITTFASAILGIKLASYFHNRSKTHHQEIEPSELDLGNEFESATIIDPAIYSPPIKPSPLNAALEGELEKEPLRTEEIDKEDIIGFLPDTEKSRENRLALANNHLAPRNDLPPKKKVNWGLILNSTDRQNSPSIEETEEGKWSMGKRCLRKIHRDSRGPHERTIMQIHTPELDDLKIRSSIHNTSTHLPVFAALSGFMIIAPDNTIIYYEPDWDSLATKPNTFQNAGYGHKATYQVNLDQINNSGHPRNFYTEVIWDGPDTITGMRQILTRSAYHESEPLFKFDLKLKGFGLGDTVWLKAEDDNHYKGTVRAIQMDGTLMIKLDDGRWIVRAHPLSVLTFRHIQEPTEAHKSSNNISNRHSILNQYQMHRTLSPTQNNFEDF